jgi:hypothetical protein
MGYALWRMGGEDPLNWTLLRHAYGAVKPTACPSSRPGRTSTSTAPARCCGSPTSPRRPPHAERRSRHGLVSAETYDANPTSYVIERYGAHPGLVALDLRRRPGPALDAEILDS